ncbi:BgTH12-05865 [Blumeria graminis f. sp. triticale]|uniref:Bgt-2575 n=3 Tax=Blumeria graminis TaxID=34373 RepID=A0A061HIX1_BLUGR|nr:t-SNARE protein [Blumeria graminis f. sp. tritici 96224]CAD6504128.1 BgTH12-05865 [Blumeria graminis f. sp. triticale]VDB90896.1 Bgt-2575 [Blumeria graminis f. sp. tritici]
MKKFGFGKKNDISKNASPAPAASNPYAQQPAAPGPYDQMNQNPKTMANNAPTQQAGDSMRPGVAQRGVSAGSAGPRGPAPNGYGANRYDLASNGNGGGYGGMGRRNSNETTNTEENREALFGGAKDRFAQRGPPSSGAGRPNGGYGGGYGDERQLTAEEEEEEDVAATKQEIRQMKRDDVSSTQRALAIAAQAEETGRATLARLGAQGERLHNTEKNLDLTSNHNRRAEEKAKELKTLNRSMFAVHVANPFTSSSRRAARDDQVQTKHQQEREERDATRQAAFLSRQRLEDNMSELRVGERPPPTKASLAERSKYQFEADSEDEDMENQIDSNLDALGNAAGRLNALARATGQEVEEQNKHIERIMIKSDRVDDQIALNRARLDRIK